MVELQDGEIDLSTYEVADLIITLFNEEAKCDHVFKRTALYERCCMDCGWEQVRDLGETVWKDKHPTVSLNEEAIRKDE